MGPGFMPVGVMLGLLFSAFTDFQVGVATANQNIFDHDHPYNEKICFNATVLDANGQYLRSPSNGWLSLPVTPRIGTRTRVRICMPYEEYPYQKRDSFQVYRVLPYSCANLKKIFQSAYFPLIDALPTQEEADCAQVLTFEFESLAHASFYIRDRALDDPVPWKALTWSATQFVPVENHRCYCRDSPDINRIFTNDHRNLPNIPTNGSAVVASNEHSTLKGSSTTSSVFFSLIGTGKVVRLTSCTQYTVLPVEISVCDGLCDCDFGEGYEDCIASAETANGVCNEGSANEMETFVQFPTTLGEVYHVQVSNQYDSYVLMTGTFGLKAFEVEMPSNSECETAQAMGPITTDETTTAVLTVSFESATNMWYRVGDLEGIGGPVVLSICDSKSALNPRAQFYQGESCGQKRDLGDISPTDRSLSLPIAYPIISCEMSNQSRAVRIDTKINKTSFVRFSSGFGGGPININAVRLIPPPNDSCETAIGPVPLDGSTVVGTNVNATLEELLYEHSVSESPTVWYTFRGNGSIRFESPSCDNGQFRFIFFEGSCEQKVALAECYNNYAANPVVLDLRKDKIYHVAVSYGYSGSTRGPESFNYSMSESSPDSGGDNSQNKNDKCETANEIAVLGKGNKEMGSASSTADAWYNLSAKTSNLLRISIRLEEALRQGGCILFVNAYQGSCDALEPINTKYESCELDQEVWSIFLEPRGALSSYYIGVKARSPATFSIGGQELVPPPNDICEDSYLTSTDGTLRFEDASNATRKIARCEGTWTDSQYRGIWSRFVGTGGPVRVLPCEMGYLHISSGRSVCNSFVDVYVGDCCNLQRIASRSCCSTEEPFQINSEQGKVYSAFLSNSSGDLNEYAVGYLSMSPPPNDQCAAATDLPLNSSVNGSVENSTNVDGPFLNCVPGSPGVFYSIVGTGSRMNITLLGGNLPLPKLRLIYGDCAAPDCYFKNEPKSYAYNLTSGVVFLSEKDVRYTLLVLGSKGQFRLSNQDLVPPENDRCTSAHGPLTTGSTVSGSLQNARYDGDFSDIRRCAVWYQLVGSGHQVQLTVDLRGLSTTIYSGQCDALRVEGENLAYLQDMEEYYVAVGHYDSCERVSPAPSFALSTLEIKHPTNDDCENAVLLSSDGSVIKASTLGASAIEEKSCVDGYRGETGIWYKFVGDGNAIDIAFIGRVAISVYIGSCGNLTCHCQLEDGSSASCRGMSSSYRINSVKGTVYFVSAVGEDKTFELGITSLLPPANNQASNAIALPVTGEAFVGTTVNATIYNNHTESNGASPTVWYRISGTGHWVTVSTCSNETNFPTNFFFFTDKEGKPSLQLQNDRWISCYGEIGRGKMGKTGRLDSMLGETYFVSVQAEYYPHGDESGILAGDFSISAQDMLPPPNDQCTDAYSLSEAIVYQALLDNATSVNTTDCSHSHYETKESGVWFRLNVSTSDRDMIDLTIRRSTCQSPSSSAPSVFLFGAECSPDKLECLGRLRSDTWSCNETTCGNGYGGETCESVYSISKEFDAHHLAVTSDDSGPNGARGVFWICAGRTDACDFSSSTAIALHDNSILQQEEDPLDDYTPTLASPSTASSTTSGPTVFPRSSSAQTGAVHSSEGGLTATEGCPSTTPTTKTASTTIPTASSPIMPPVGSPLTTPIGASPTAGVPTTSPTGMRSPEEARNEIVVLSKGSSLASLTNNLWSTAAIIVLYLIT